MAIAAVIWCGVRMNSEPNDDSAKFLPKTTRQQHQRDADDGRFLDVPLAPHEHVEAHEDGDGNRRADREHAPGAFRQRVDDDEAEAGEGDDQDEEDRDDRGDAGDRSDFRPGDFGQ